MTAAGFALFDTTIGRCGVAWGKNAPPAEVRRALEAIGALLRGEASDLAAVPLDMEGVPPFHRRVYEAARGIPPGATLSYGEIAHQLGSPGSARAVGQALGRNPFAIVVPCHRVLAAGGKMGGFSANGGVSTKVRMLSLERGHALSIAEFEGDGAFGFDVKDAVEHLRESDAVLARLIDTVGPFRMQLQKTTSLFTALAEAVVSQQLNGKAAATIFARVRALFPRAHEGLSPKHLLRAPDEKLRGAGLSRAKLLALRDLAQRGADGKIPTLAEIHRMDNDAIIERLTEVRGIGRWTVEMLLMFRLGRPDVLPLDDYGIRKGFAVLTKKSELPDKKILEKRGARWKPYRTVASWYLWRAAEGAKL
jgi:methylated-DNA-[protein]-cysteine S-methyltransferase